MNIEDKEGTKETLDFENQVQRWKTINEEEIFISCETEDGEKMQVNIAKEKELNNWKNYQVYEEVEDNGQKLISLTWVCTKKKKDDETILKARLVARGFEEKEDMKVDSPTGSKECMKMLIAITASKKWTMKSIDIKAAFLQGQPINRELYVKPPPEAESPPGVVWKLKKSVYGLNDAAKS